jgi:hypothetical protein
MRLIEIKPSHKPEKRYDAIFDTGQGRTKTVPFGDANMENYTIHKDLKRREAYRSRHRKDLQTLDPTKPGFLSYFILWGDSTDLNANIRAYKKKYNL